MCLVMEMESIGAHIDRVAQEWSDGVDHGAGWAIKLISAKHHAATGSWKVVDTAMDIMGGGSIFKQVGFERLWRDARLARIHPANNQLAMEVIGKLALGINPDETPRWG